MNNRLDNLECDPSREYRHSYDEREPPLERGSAVEAGRGAAWHRRVGVVSRAAAAEALGWIKGAS